MLNKVPLGTSSNEMRCTFAYVEVLGLGARVFQPGDPVPKDGKRMRRRGYETTATRATVILSFLRNS